MNKTSAVERKRRSHELRGPASREGTLRPFDPPKLLLPVAAVMIAAAMFFGGAGVNYPLLSGLIELLAIGVLWVCLSKPSGVKVGPDWLVPLTIVAIILVPIVQLIPLPQNWWTALPGRAEAASALQTAGLPLGTRALSLTPEATIQSALALLPGFAAFAAAIRLGSSGWAKLLYIILAAALFSAVLGALQKASGGGALILFETAHAANAPGLFVNRNHQAAFLLASMPLAAALSRIRQVVPDLRSKVTSAGLILVLVAGAVATTSRMAIVIVPVALLISALIIMEPRRSLKTLGIGAAICAVVGWSALQISGVQAVLSRFTGTDIRYQYWQDTIDGIRHFWPAGSGLGTYSTIFPTFENLNSINSSRVYNAHNDYLELLFEGGFPVVLAALFFIAMLLRRGCRAAVSDSMPGQRIPALAALGSVTILLLHSIVDYPLRMLSCLTLFGFVLGLLVASTSRASTADMRGKRA